MTLFNRAPVVLLLAFLVSFAAAQTLPTFSHIIIIVQENRTPDNLFGSQAAGPSGCPNTAPFEPGVDIVNGGNNIVKGQTGLICNSSLPMNSGSDPNHQYEDWFNDYDSAHMDGFCDGTEYTWPNCPSYSYVQQSDVNPYFSIASTYGFANYMFQTNEGPSFEAHQFLFTGTAAPVAPKDANGYFWDFAKDNANFTDSGCPIATGAPSWIQPDGTTVAAGFGAECYPHDSLVTGSTCTNGICDKSATLTWRYYTPSTGIIWDAPESIPEVCYGANSNSLAGSACGGPEWNNHITLYSLFQNAPIFSDIESCNLANISWVIPDQNWSDHPFVNDEGVALGPNWVGDIVNAIGNSYANSGNKCDYWGTNVSSGAEPTAIFVVWDDWGGFYDHVPPPHVWRGSKSGSTWVCSAPNQWGCGYTYGFRVPLLVVSEYTGTSLGSGNFGGYISGPCGISGQPTCPNTTAIYQHDFGSILAFTENNFSLPRIASPYYADSNALDAIGSNIPLSDFFALYTGSGSKGRPFAQISVNPYPASFFQSYYTTHNTIPTGPDTD